MSNEVYCYPPDFNVLKNKLGLREAEGLDYFEREFVYARAMQEMPTGDFDLAHLCAIHHHLFQDVYDWAGQVRTVEISKGGSQFQPKAYIETGMADVHRRIVGQHYLRRLSPDEFSKQVGHIIGDVNYVHPFREGNGRTQLYFYKQLAARAGHDVDLTQLEQESWMAASRAAHQGEYEAMAECLRATLGPDRVQHRDRVRRR